MKLSFSRPGARRSQAFTLGAAQPWSDARPAARARTNRPNASWQSPPRYAPIVPARRGAKSTLVYERVKKNAHVENFFRGGGSHAARPDTASSDFRTRCVIAHRWRAGA